MAEPKLVKIRNIKTGTVCECSEGSAEKLTATPQWEMAVKAAPRSSAKSDD